jgi:hypothetical protein
VLTTQLTERLERLERLERISGARMNQVMGVAVIDAMPPAEILARLLRRVYGDHAANEHVVEGLLGGAGHDAEGADLSLAGSTTVLYELGAAEPETYSLTSTVSYGFPRPVTDLTMTIFTTSDARLRDVIVTACSRPLFDWVYFADEEQWRAVHGEPVSVEIGARFLDENDREYVTDLETVTPAWVPFEQWPEHLTLFRQSVRSRPRQDPRKYLQSLKVFTVDLAALAPRGISPVAISGLTQRYRTIHPDEGNTYWQPPFPCLLEQVSVDASQFASNGERTREFLLQPFLNGTALVDEPKNWVKADELPIVKVGTWVLPGHGFILLWREAPHPDERTTS